MSRKFLILLSVLIISGCSCIKKENKYIYDRKDDYQAEQSVPRMQIPKSISADKISDFYEIPETKDQIPSPDTGLAPPGATQWDKVQLAKKKKKGSRYNQFFLPESTPEDAVEEKWVEDEGDEPKAPSKVKGFSNDMPTMSINTNFDKSWKSLEKAFKVAEYPVFGKDKQLKIYFIADAPAQGGKVTRDTPLYQVHLMERNKETLIFVIDNNGEQLPNEKSQEVLKALTLALKGKRSVNIIKWLFEV